MTETPTHLFHDLFTPNTAIGAVFIGLLFILAATVVAILIQRLSKRAERHLTDVTGLRFAGAFMQVLTFVFGFILYAHLIPELRALATAFLAGVSVASVVLGIAAQTTLSNLIAGFSLVLYRSISVGDTLQLTTPKGLTIGTVEQLSLGNTILRDSEGNEIIVPNSVMVSSVVILISRADKGCRPVLRTGAP
ncbi:MAG: mechanosensitive ion channel [Candidatus Aureabacteria bacterium]|nr:mechanosensitive ion channel [Candidatus Auribacterota bacterium]